MEQEHPDIVERIAAHGGIRGIHVVRLTVQEHDGLPRRYDGWQNVAVCMDGTRLGLSPEDEEALCDSPHGSDMRAAMDAWPTALGVRRRTWFALWSVWATLVGFLLGAYVVRRAPTELPIHSAPGEATADGG
jgi:hypothetical protein